MNTFEHYITDYIEYCAYRKRLNSKTLKAYRTDLMQYKNYPSITNDWNCKNTIDSFITTLHQQYKPKTVKRKIASLKAFFHYLTYQEIIEANPFEKLDISFREAKLLPKTIPFHTIQIFLKELYSQKELARSDYQLKCYIRDIADFA